MSSCTKNSTNDTMAKSTLRWSVYKWTECKMYSKHPAPTVDEIAASLQGNQLFNDVMKAYGIATLLPQCITVRDRDVTGTGGHIMELEVSDPSDIVPPVVVTVSLCLDP